MFSGLHVTVAAVIEQQGRFLLVEEEIAGKRVLNQPAGHLEDDENLLDAVIRETLEETAYQFEPHAIIGLYRWRIGPDKTFLRATFSGSANGFDAERPLDRDILRTHWLEPETIAHDLNRLRSPLVMRSIDDYLSGKRYPLDLLVDLD